jgi:MMP 1-O-methyltransferase
MLVRSANELASRLEGVEGWLLPGEAWALYRAVVGTVEQVDSPTVVELGSWKGRSTIALASGLSQGHGIVYAVDPHLGDDGDKATEQGETFSEFQSNVDRAGVADRVRPLRTTSRMARIGFSDRSVHLLFVDASHRYKDVLQDIDDWTPKLHDQAVAAFNDPFGDGVSRALRERVLTHRSPYRRPHIVDNTLFSRYSPTVPWRPKDDLALWRMRVAIILGRRWLQVRPKVPKRLAHALKFLRRLFVGASTSAS